MSEPQPREQRNEGPGTFINGNIEGGVRNLFFFGTTHGKKSGSKPAEKSEIGTEHEASEDDDPGDALFFSIFLGSMPAAAVGHSLGLISIKGWSNHQSVLERVGLTVAGIAGVLMCTACALARLAQIFALWAGRACDSAKANAPRHSRIAAGSARTASSAAWLARTSAALASAIAVLFAWFSLGGTVSSRAHDAGSEATAQATEAWARVRRHRSKTP